VKNTEEPIRVAQIMGKMNSGGVESCVMNYYRNIDRTKVQFDFIVIEGSTLPQREEIEKLGGNIIEIPSYIHIFKYIIELIKIFKQNKYKIVHSHLNTLSILPLFSAYIAKVPNRIAHSHSTSNKEETIKNILKNILKPFSKIFATKFIACSEYAGRWLFGSKAFENKKIEIMKNAIDLDKFKYDKEIRSQVRKELNIEEKFVIGHVGRFMKQKNHEFLIETFYEVQKKREDSILLLIGEGPLEEKIKKKVKLLNIEEKVIFLGAKNNVNEYMQAMDLFVFPSLYEGLGIVVIEAQALGITCICSNNVPKDVDIIGNVEFLPNNSLEKWEKMIVDCEYLQSERKIDVEKIRRAGYDIKISNLQLQNCYLNMVNRG